MENKKIRVAITHGDTNGIGYEIKESFRAVALKGWLSGEKDKGTFI